MTGLSIKSLFIGFFALALTACSSTYTSRYVYEPVTNEHHELTVVDNQEFTYDSSASFAMNSKNLIGVEMNVIDAKSPEDSVRYYSTGERVAGALIDYAANGIMGAVADVTVTGQANDEASKAKPYMGVFVDKALIDEGDLKSSFSSVRDVVGKKLFDAAAKELEGAEYVGTYTATYTNDKAVAMTLFSAPQCQSLREKYGYKSETIWTGYLLDYAGDARGMCRIGLELEYLKTSDEALANWGAEGKALVKVKVMAAEFLDQAFAKHIEDGFFVTPFRYKTSSQKFWITNHFPSVGYQGKAHLFTKGNHTTDINVNL